MGEQDTPGERPVTFHLIFLCEPELSHAALLEAIRELFWPLTVVDGQHTCTPSLYAYLCAGHAREQGEQTTTQQS